MNELEIIENKTTREKLIERVDVLDKVKKVILLPFGDFMTNKQVAEYYEVGEKAITSLVFDNKEEIENNGYYVYKGNELCNSHVISFEEFTKNRANYKFYDDKGNVLSVGGKGIALFTRRAILNVGMLLRDSKIAKEIRTSLLNMSENKEAIQQEVNNIDTEKLLMLDIMCAKDDMQQMIAMNKYKRYKDEQKAKIEAEKKVAVEKVENLTKSDATMGLREVKNNLGVKEKSLRNFILENKYCYRKHKKDDKKGNPTGVLMPYEQYTKGDTRYFTIIKQIDRIGNPHSQMVFTIEGIEHFRKLKSEIEKF